MKTGMIMMLILILATNVYVVWRMYQILPALWLKIALPVLYVLTLLTYIVCFVGMLGHGQLWPISLLTDLMYEKSWGPHHKGTTTYYISSGLGIWGPKFRLGSQSEYLVVTVSSTL